MRRVDYQAGEKVGLRIEHQRPDRLSPASQSTAVASSVNVQRLRGTQACCGARRRRSRRRQRACEHVRPAGGKGGRPPASVRDPQSGQAAVAIAVQPAGHGVAWAWLEQAEGSDVRQQLTLPVVQPTGCMGGLPASSFHGCLRLPRGAEHTQRSQLRLKPDYRRSSLGKPR